MSQPRFNVSGSCAAVRLLLVSDLLFELDLPLIEVSASPTGLILRLALCACAASAASSALAPASFLTPPLSILPALAPFLPLLTSLTFLPQTMSSTGAGYDSSAGQYSPDGRVFQVEYAQKAVDNSGSVMAVRCTDGVVMGVEKLLISKMLVAGTGRRLHSIDEHMTMYRMHLS